MAAAELVRTSRRRAGLSGRALAARAGVAYSTVVRIESGQVDPTTGMLERLLAAADHRLVISADEVAPPELADLSSAWRTAADGEPRPDWTSLRAFIDTLALHPQWRARAIERPATSTDSDVMDNLLAGIAEKIADDAGLSRPAWTLNVTPLREAWFTPGTPQMRESARASAPDQLAARSIWVSTESLWRTGVQRAPGYQIISLPTRLGTASGAGEAIRRFLGAGNEDAAFRAVLQLAADLARADPALRVALCVTPPALSGNPQFDALLAGVVDWELSTDGLPMPTWVSEGTRTLSEPWDVEPVPALRDTARQRTPDALRRHGVYLDPAELVDG